MKKIIFLSCFIQIFVSSLTAKEPAVISGVWNRGSQKEVLLYQVVSGHLNLMSTCVLQEDKTFGFAFNVQEEGFYVIGDKSSQSGQDKFTFYFKPGDALSVEVNDTTYLLTGKNTEENKAVADWAKYVYRIEFPSYHFFKTLMTYEDFFPLMQECINRPYKPLPTKNPVFNRLFAQYRTFNFLDIATIFLNTPRPKHPEISDYPDFYRSVDIPALTQSTYLLTYPYGANLLQNLFLLKERFRNEKYTDLEMLSEIKNDTIKGEIILEKATFIKSYLGYVDLADKYGQYILLPDQKRRATEIITKLAEKENQSGSVAINFTGKDVDDKDVSLSDFKGKMVYVDIWATWCGPCVSEIPHFKKLIEEYKGKDIVFMSVSIDDAKDKEKWKKFLISKEMQGLQLFAGNGWQSDVAKFYQVKSIPRFMLFDKEGKVISTDAPRPSSTEIRLVIQKGLAEN